MSEKQYIPHLQVPIDPKLKTRLKIQAMLQGITLAEFATNALEAALSVTEPAKKK